MAEIENSCNGEDASDETHPETHRDPKTTRPPPERPRLLPGQKCLRRWQAGREHQGVSPFDRGHAEKQGEGRSLARAIAITL